MRYFKTVLDLLALSQSQGYHTQQCASSRLNKSTSAPNGCSVFCVFRELPDATVCSDSSQNSANTFGERPILCDLSQNQGSYATTQNHGHTYFALSNGKQITNELPLPPSRTTTSHTLGHHWCSFTRPLPRFWQIWSWQNRRLVSLVPCTPIRDRNIVSKAQTMWASDGRRCRIRENEMEQQTFPIEWVLAVECSCRGTWTLGGNEVLGRGRRRQLRPWYINYRQRRAQFNSEPDIYSFSLSLHTPRMKKDSLV